MNIKDVLNDSEKERRSGELFYEISSAHDNLRLDPQKVILTAYLMYKVKEQNCKDISLERASFETLELSDRVQQVMEKKLDKDTWESVQYLLDQYSLEDFAQVVFTDYPKRALNKNEHSYTPDSLNQLAYRLLCPEKGNAVADLCSGIGTFITTATLENPDAEYVGYELDEVALVISEVRAELLGANITLNLQDVLSIVPSAETKKYDRIFANYPFGMRSSNVTEAHKYLKYFSKNHPEVKRISSMDWMFNSLMCDLLTEDGKAIGITTIGSTTNMSDLTARKYFIESGLIECVIALPEKLFYETDIPTTMILFSRKKNNEIRFIDATDLCRKGRRRNELESADIEQIVKMTAEDGLNSKAVSLEEIREKDYVLNVNRYLADPVPQFENEVPFGEVMTLITRGASCTASDLDELSTKNKTNKNYLLLGNINDGIIDSELPYLKTIAKKYEKYCLQDQDLIISKNGHPYKIAVACVPEGQKILLTGNLFLIRIDQKKANPYYLKAFFESETGVLALNKITVGTTIPTLGIKALKEMMIPLPELEEQNRIAGRYVAVMQELIRVKMELARTKKKLEIVFDKEMGGTDNNVVNK